MRRTVNVKRLLISKDKKKNMGKRKNVKLLRPYPTITKEKKDVGKVFPVSGRLGKHLIRSGAAIEVKEEKAVRETKEEKFAPSETKDYSQLTLKQIEDVIRTLKVEELAGLLHDERVGARRLAQEEIARREG